MAEKYNGGQVYNIIQMYAIYWKPEGVYGNLKSGIGREPRENRAFIGLRSRNIIMRFIVYDVRLVNQQQRPKLSPTDNNDCTSG